MVEFCGTDIIEVERVKDSIQNTKGFKEKVFTKNEIEVGEAKSENTKYQYYAGRFAAKEAVYKALSAKYGHDLWIGDIEVLNDKKSLNRPCVILLKEELNQLQKDDLLRIDISISHIEKFAVAFAIANIDG